MLTQVFQTIPVFAVETFRFSQFLVGLGRLTTSNII
jgi:hypothetical protein